MCAKRRLDDHFAVENDAAGVAGDGAGGLLAGRVRRGMGYEIHAIDMSVFISHQSGRLSREAPGSSRRASSGRRTMPPPRAIVNCLHRLSGPDGYSGNRNALIVSVAYTR